MSNTKDTKNPVRIPIRRKILFFQLLAITSDGCVESSVYPAGTSYKLSTNVAEFAVYVPYE